VESSIDPGASALLPRFLADFHPNFPVGYDDRAAAQAYLQLSVMVPFYVPKMVFLDREGTIRFQSDDVKDYFIEMDKNVRATLEFLLKPAPAARKGAKR